jgi:hypothetical protein
LDTYAHDSLNKADIDDFRAVLHPVPRSPPIPTFRRTPPVTSSMNYSKSRKRPRLEDDVSSARSCMSPASGTASRNDGPTKAPQEHLTGRPADPAKTTECSSELTRTCVFMYRWLTLALLQTPASQTNVAVTSALRTAIVAEIPRETVMILSEPTLQSKKRCSAGLIVTLP